MSSSLGIYLKRIPAFNLLQSWALTVRRSFRVAFLEGIATWLRLNRFRNPPTFAPHQAAQQQLQQQQQQQQPQQPQQPLQPQQPQQPQQAQQPQQQVLGQMVPPAAPAPAAGNRLRTPRKSELERLRETWTSFPILRTARPIRTPDRLISSDASTTTPKSKPSATRRLVFNP